MKYQRTNGPKNVHLIFGFPWPNSFREDVCKQVAQRATVAHLRAIMNLWRCLRSLRAANSKVCGPIWLKNCTNPKYYVCYYLGNDAQYKYWRNKVISLIRKAKQEKYETYIETNKGKPGSIYKLFQEVGAGKGAKKQSSISSIKNSEDQCSEDPAEIADTFNDFFVNIASKIKEPVSHSNHDKLKDFCQDRLPEGTRFEIPCIDMVNVRKYLSNVDVSKATGTDNIGPRLL